MYGLRVILVEPDQVSRRFIKEKLLNAGHLVVGEFSNVRKALTMIYNIQPDLAIISVRLPGREEMDVAKMIGDQRLAPVILITEPDKQDELAEILEDWTVSYVLRPVDDHTLFPAIEVCMAMFKKICRLEEENRKLKQTLENRKIIEKAKGLLIEYGGMTERQAFKHLQKESMDKCLPIQNVAKQVIRTYENKAKKCASSAK